MEEALSINEAIKKRILELCHIKGLSIYKLAQLSCLTQSTINSVLHRNNSKTSIYTILKICNGLDITLSEFFDTDYFHNIFDE